MKLDSIEIENFKLFKHKKFEFNSNFNLIIGINGSGKTSLLNAVAVAVAGWAHSYIANDNNLRPIEDNEIREIQIDQRFDKTKETRIKAVGKALVVSPLEKCDEGIALWQRTRKEGSSTTITSAEMKYAYPAGGGFSDKSYNVRFEVLINRIFNYIERKNHFDLPIIAFYECNRLWKTIEKIDIEEAATLRHSRFDPYIDCFHTGSDDKAIGQWLLSEKLISLDEGRDTQVLKAIKYAAISALENCSDFKFDFKEKRVMVEFDDGSAIPFEHLSDGQRTILGLFCDIARRAAILNPHLGGEASEKVKGVVLIDELDLHLHPKWQRRIIEDLRRVFPNIQFICTTHSPFLIQSLRSSEELIMLNGEPLSQYSNLGIEEISKNMGVERPDVSINYEKMKTIAKSFLQELDEMDNTPEEKQEKFKERLASIISPFADNPAYQAFLELKYAAKTGKDL
ncbi:MULTISPECIES: AAA family ATPase [Vibrio]|uniref:AAA family ATPase n=1 Tax=Vibrio TaxID=662 RepID=UPI0002EA06EE|nr:MULTISPECIES: AAA family ATPase [Vibrio]OCH54104.1 chromosome segregation protein SMC [Vibrio lentus]